MGYVLKPVHGLKSWIAPKLHRWNVTKHTTQALEVFTGPYRII